jgi:hypothetical protein
MALSPNMLIKSSITQSNTRVELILKSLGVTRTFTRLRRHLYMLDEVVNNRNSISHGEETPLDIGRRYSRPDILKRIRLTQKICLRLVSIVAEHCDEPSRQCRA